MDLQQRLTRVFLITFALLLGFGAHYLQHNQGGSGLELPQNNVVFIFLSVLIGIGLWKITEQQKIFYSRFTVVFLSAFLLFFIPLFYPNSELADQSYTRLMGLFAGFLLFISLQQFQFDRTNIKRLLLLVVLAGFLQSCYSLMQDYLLPANNIFGYNVGSGRPFGVFQQPNVLASFMATTLILAGYLLQQINDKKLQVFLFVTALLNMWVITITMSRTGYLGTLIAVALLVPWAWQSNKKKLGLFILALLLGIGFASIKGDALSRRSAEDIKEVGARLHIYKHSWGMIKKHPLMGYGYGGFEKNFLITKAAADIKKNPSSTIATFPSHPHNEMLFWAVEGGIIPILAILLLVVSFIRLLRAFELSYAMALMALVIPIAVHTQTELPFYHSALHWLVLLVLVFYISSGAESMQQQIFKPTFALRVFALLIPVLTTVFMLTNLQAISKVTKYERSKNPDVQLLIDVINPMVFKQKFECIFNNHRLSAAVRLNKTDEIQAVINSLENAVKRAPKANFYHLLYIAYINNQQPEKAKQTLDYARYLYPKDLILMDADKPPGQAESASSSQRVGSVLIKPAALSDALPTQ